MYKKIPYGPAINGGPCRIYLIRKTMSRGMQAAAIIGIPGITVRELNLSPYALCSRNRRDNNGLRLRFWFPSTVQSDFRSPWRSYSSSDQKNAMCKYRRPNLQQEQRSYVRSWRFRKSKTSPRKLSQSVISARCPPSRERMTSASS